MIIVLQCAGTKVPAAGALLARDGTPIVFVAEPGSAPDSPTHSYAHPDEQSDEGKTWRQVLVEYNDSGVNNLGLKAASDLYAPPADPSIYIRLAHHFGPEHFFVLSAGWGLIRSDFLTPYYDITFAREVIAKGEAWKHRSRSSPPFHDFRHIPNHVQDDVVFVGSKAYVKLFCELTASVRTKRVVYYNSREAPTAPGCDKIRFLSPNKRTWQYTCARALIGDSHEAEL